MKTIVHDIQWEIDQLLLAIKYYEEAYAKSSYLPQSTKYMQNVKDLKNKVKQLERKRENEQGY